MLDLFRHLERPQDGPLVGPATVFDPVLWPSLEPRWGLWQAALARNAWISRGSLTARKTRR